MADNHPLDPLFPNMWRLFEDDVTPDNVEAHIAAYEASLPGFFSQAQLDGLKPIHDRFYAAVREFAAYDVGREPA